MTDKEIKHVVEKIEKTHGTRIVYAELNQVCYDIALAGTNNDLYRIPIADTFDEKKSMITEINAWLDRRLRERERNAGEV